MTNCPQLCVFICRLYVFSASASIIACLTSWLNVSIIVSLSILQNPLCLFLSVSLLIFMCGQLLLQVSVPLSFLLEFHCECETYCRYLCVVTSCVFSITVAFVCNGPIICIVCQCFV